MSSTIINNIAQELLKLKNIITDIKEAIIEKGVQSEGKLSKFPEEIKSISSNGSSEYDDCIQFEHNGGYSGQPINVIQTIIGKNVTNLYELFSRIGYQYLKSISSLSNTSHVTNMEAMFRYCYYLTTIPEFDTSNVTNMSDMFYVCSSLLSIPKLDTSNVTNMNGMFWYCRSLKTIPQLDTSKVTNMSYMFSECKSLTEIPPLNTNNVKFMNHMFDSCYITSIPALDVSNVIDMEEMFYDCPFLERIDMYGMKVSFDLSGCRKLTTEEINKIFRNCGQTESGAYITLPNTEQAKAADKLIAEAKGWGVGYSRW